MLCAACGKAKNTSAMPSHSAAVASTVQDSARRNENGAGISRSSAATEMRQDPALRYRVFCPAREGFGVIDGEVQAAALLAAGGRGDDERRYICQIAEL